MANRTERLLTRRRLLAAVGASGVALVGVAAMARAQGPGAKLEACVVRPRQTEGPFFVDEGLERSDIRSDPKTGAVSAGVPLRLEFRVARMSAGACAPLAGARLDVWHSDAEGRYSDTRGFGEASTRGQQFLRGFQVTDDAGIARFITIYPGWYGGRAVHVHFKIRTRDADGRTRDFTSQLYFDDSLNERVFAREPYSRRGRRWLRNAQDGIFRDGGEKLLLVPEPDGEGYAASFDVAIA